MSTEKKYKGVIVPAVTPLTTNCRLMMQQLQKYLLYFTSIIFHHLF